MTQLRFGTGTTVRDFNEYRQWLQTAEGIGFDILTCGDSQSLWAECFTLMTFAAVPFTLLVATFAASYLPARRVSAIDPVKCMKTE